jgi:hypothetical protein
MIFIVAFKSPGGRVCKLNCIAPNFEECLKKISSLYGKNLISITYDLRKNSEATADAVS